MCGGSGGPQTIQTSPPTSERGRGLPVRVCHADEGLSGAGCYSSVSHFNTNQHSVTFDITLNYRIVEIFDIHQLKISDHVHNHV